MRAACEAVADFQRWLVDGDMYTLRPSEDDVNRVVIATLERTGGSNDQVHAGLLAHVRKWLSDIPDQACDPLELKQMALQMEQARQ